MKKSILALTFLGTSLQAMEAERPQEKFNFAGLPHDVQNLVIQQAWADIDTVENMKQLAASNFDVFQKAETSGEEQNKYGFYGRKIPINFYTLRNGQPCISTVGHILKNAKPIAALASLQQFNDYPFTTPLFIHSPENTLLSIELNLGLHHTLVDVKSACFSVLGHLAITWEDTKNYDNFVAVFNLQDLQGKKELDLSQNAIKLDKKNKRQKQLSDVKAPRCLSLFTLDGSKLLIQLKDVHTSLMSQEYTYEAFDDVIRDIPNDQPLTPAEKAKRLGIATVGAKALIDTHLRKTT